MSLPEPVPEALEPFFESPRTEQGFRNPWQAGPVPGFADVLRWKMGTNEARPRGYRPRPIPLPQAPLADFEGLAPAPTRVFWIGHASFLLEMEGVRLAIDPVFGRAGGLVPRITPPAAAPEQLGSLDAVLVTHGHHDHFDRASLRALARHGEGKTCFIVPLGLARALPVECTPHVEIDWWEYVQLGGVRVHFVPAQHWHRRGAFDLNAALWGGFVVAGTHRVYHSGDTGYFGGFRAIAHAFGGLDLACLPLGAYEPRWFMQSQHMSPEQSLTALDDLRARHLFGMHWGVYDLSDEPIDAGPGLLFRTAAERGVEPARLHVVRPGGSVALNGQGAELQTRVLHGLEPPSTP